MVRPNLKLISKSSQSVIFLTLSGICAGSFLLRIYVSQFHPFVQWDGAYYINYFRDSTWQSVFHPGYSIFIELFRLFIYDGFRAAQMVSIIAGSILPLPLYFLAIYYLKPLPSIISVIIVICNPLVIRFSVMTMSESLFILIEVVLFLIYLKNKRFLFGIVGGLGYLIRPEGIVPFLLLIIYDFIKRKNRSSLILAAAGFLLMALPYMIYLKMQTGDWTISAKTMNLRVWEKDWRINVSQEASDAPTYSFRERLESGLKHYPNRLLGYIEKLLKYFGIPMVIIGFIGMLKYRTILIAAMPMLFILPLFGLDPNERFLLPYFPFIVLSSIFLVSTWKSKILQMGAIIIIMIGYLPTKAYAVTPEEGITEFCRAGMDIKPITNSGDIFVDRKPFTAFYAGGRYLPMPNDPVDSILKFCRDNDARFLVVSARVVRVFRPQLNFLLYSDTVLNRLNLKTVYVKDLDSGYGIRIIEVKNEKK